MATTMVVFDIAGTTVKDENHVAASFIHAFESSGFTVTTADANPLMGYHKPLAIRIMLEQLGAAVTDELVDKIHRAFEEEMIDFYAGSPSVQPMDDTEEVFMQLKEKGVRVVLNTGFSRIIADTIVGRFQWMERGLVDDYIGSNEVERGRPYTDMINILMTRGGIEEAGTVVKVGDTPVDIEEGRNAGCGSVIAVTTGATTESVLIGYEPDHIVHNLSAILPIVLS